MAFGQMSALSQTPKRRFGQDMRLAQINAQAPNLIFAKQQQHQRRLQEQQFGLQDRLAGLEEENVDIQERRLESDIDFKNKQLGFQEEQMKAAKESEKRQFGVEAGKLGLNLAMNAPKTSLGDIFKPGQSGFFGSAASGIGKATGLGGTRFMGEVGKAATMGSTVGAGLAGFGAANLFGGESKIKKAAIGAGVGALLGGFTGGGLSGGALGAAFGGLGSLF